MDIKASPRCASHIYLGDPPNMDLRHSIMAVPLAISIGVGVILGLTKVITTYQFYRAKSRAPYEGKREPPTVPYWIPWLGSLLPFLLSQSLFLDEIS